MALHQRPRIAGIALPVQHARGAGIGLLVLLDLLVAPAGGSRSSPASARRAFVGGVEIVGVQLG